MRYAAYVGKYFYPKKWDKTWTMEELMARGEQAYNKACAVCHQPNGAGMPPIFPALKGSPMATEADQIGAHVDIVMNGKKGSAMQAFAGQLNEVDLAAVITYERNAWGNNTGEMVTPKEIVEYKKTGKYVEDPAKQAMPDNKQASL